MGVILGFVSIKGGVGKTTIALETATSLVKYYNKKVLLVDANFSAPNLGLYLNMVNTEVGLHDVLFGLGLHNAIYEKNGVDIVPAHLEYKGEVDNFKLRDILNKVKNRYDFIILDSSPNYDELVPVVAACDKIFVITTADMPTLTTSLKAAQIAKSKKTPIEGMIINRIRNPKYELELENVENISGIPVVAKIKDDKAMAEAIHYKTPISIHKESSPVSKEIKKFVTSLCGLPGEEGFFSRLIPFKNFFGKERVNRELMRKNFYESSL